MINTIEEFAKLHPYADIVNYDAKYLFDYGLTYRTKTKTLERFRKINGKYIEYPNIQPYLDAEDKNGYELFIIHNRKMYQLLKNDDETYKIAKELENINPDIYKDDVFYDQRKLKNPVIHSKELVLTVIE